jgi:glycopeptide antibiotics resistance protein
MIFRLYRLRTLGRGRSFRHEILLLTFVVYLSGLATATLIPNHNSRSAAEAAMGIDLRPNLASLTCSSATLPRGSTARAFCLHNAKGNVMLFFPLGILMPLVWKRLRFWSGIQIAIAVSVGIELVQYLSTGWSNRNADINDVVLNVFGAFLGLAIVFLLRLLRGTRLAVARA